jgi:hypothetical protein
MPRRAQLDASGILHHVMARGIELVPVQKWSFRPRAALLGCPKMLTYREYAPLFRLPRALHANENPHFWTGTN